MTDIKLLPLPEGVDVIFSPDGNGAALDVFTAEQVQDISRANVAHHTAKLQAEIEALRAEVDQYKRRADAYFQTAEQQGKHAERLAEALREIERLMPDQAGPAWIAKTIASAALRDHDQEGKDG